jgi:hypothetical protein
MEKVIIYYVENKQEDTDNNKGHMQSNAEWM